MSAQLRALAHHDDLQQAAHTLLGLHRNRLPSQMNRGSRGQAATCRGGSHGETLTTTASSFVPYCRHGVLGSALVEPGGMASTRGAVRRTLGPRTLQASWQMRMNLRGQPSARNTTKPHSPQRFSRSLTRPHRTPSCGQGYRQTGLSELRLQAVRARCSPRRTAGTAGSEDTRWVGNTRR